MCPEIHAPLLSTEARDTLLCFDSSCDLVDVWVGTKFSDQV